MDMSKKRLLPVEKLDLLLGEIEQAINDPSCTTKCCEALKKIKLESSSLLKKSNGLQERFNHLNRYCQ